MMLVLICLSPTAAIERLGYIGQSFSFPLFFRDQHSYNEMTYHMDMGYFLHENVGNVLVHQRSSRWFGTVLSGIRASILSRTRYMDDAVCLSQTFVFMVPNGDAGWIASFGFEMPLSKSYEAENFRLRFGTGMGQFLFDSGNVLFMQLARVGLIWSF
ncbi:MAG: hypothetical protein R2877_04690 [Bdellovibrionota bacterium]